MFHLKHDKIHLKGAWSGSMGHFNFNPIRKFRMGEARNVKFGIRIDLGKSHLTHDRTPAGAEFLILGTACIYLDRVKLDTSNFTNSCKCHVASTSYNG